MKVIIAGSRDIEDFELVAKAMAFSHFKPTEIVSGGARGVDKLGEEWARRHGIPVTLFLADWKTHGKKAGPIRNLEMLDYVNGKGGLVAIWKDGSPGTQHIITSAMLMKYDVQVYVHNLDRKSSSQGKLK